MAEKDLKGNGAVTTPDITYNIYAQAPAGGPSADDGYLTIQATKDLMGVVLDSYPVGSNGNVGNNSFLKFTDTTMTIDAGPVALSTGFLKEFSVHVKNPQAGNWLFYINGVLADTVAMSAVVKSNLNFTASLAFTKGDILSVQWTGSTIKDVRMLIHTSGV